MCVCAAKSFSEQQIYGFSIMSLCLVLTDSGKRNENSVGPSKVDYILTSSPVHHRVNI